MRRHTLFAGTVMMLATAIATLLAIAGCDHDNDTSGTAQIYGVVDSVDGQLTTAIQAAVVGVTVYLNGPISRSAVTDATGYFIFADLPAGSYTLRFSYNGNEGTMGTGSLSGNFAEVSGNCSFVLISFLAVGMDRSPVFGQQKESH